MNNENDVDSFITLVHTFNPNSNRSDIPTFRGKDPKRRRIIK